MANLFQYILIIFFISSNPLLSQNDSNIPKLPRAVIIAEQLAGKLVKLENEDLVRYKLDPEKAIDHFLFYYSASWSPSCRKFTPDLIEFYNKAKKQNSNFEIVFISSDDSEKEMLAYIKKAKMPWPIIKFEEIDKLDFLKKAGGRGVPCVSVLNSRGLILAHSYRGKTSYIGTQKPLSEFSKLIGFSSQKDEAESPEASKE